MRWPLVVTDLPEVVWVELLTSNIVVGILVFLAFLLIGFLVGRVTKRILRALGVSDIVEGTTFERSVQGFGSSTVTVMARLTSWFVYGVGALVGLHIMNVLDANIFWQQVTVFIPQFFVALLIVIVGIIIGEKAGLVVTDRLSSIKLPEVIILSSITKYSIILLAVLVALAQVGVATTALLIVFGGYVFGLVFLGGIACKDLLRSGAAGIYILLHQPYGIGDEVQIGDQGGIVQEVDLFVTHLESEDASHVIPNASIFHEGVIHRD